MAAAAKSRRRRRRRSTHAQDWTDSDEIQRYYQLDGLTPLGGTGSNQVFRLATGEVVKVELLDSPLRLQHNEVRALRALKGLNVAPHLYDQFPNTPGDPASNVLVMSGMGPDLQQCLDQVGPWHSSKVSEWSKALCDLVSVCHEQGIVHHDIKPENITTINPRGQITIDQVPELRLIDFGTAQFGDCFSEVKGRGDITGTPPYVSYRQWDTAMPFLYDTDACHMVAETMCSNEPLPWSGYNFNSARDRSEIARLQADWFDQRPWAQ